MGKIRILDCTLRDGGYINQWYFGEKNINNIIDRILEAKIDIIECGFLTQKGEYSKEYSKFNYISEIEDLIKTRNQSSLFMCMINYGEYSEEDIPSCANKNLGIRIAFHKKDLEESLVFCKKLQKKGYDIFIQPMMTISYNEEELLELINRTNEINPKALYIVDSFGATKKHDVVRMFQKMNVLLNKEISIGYHSHNNLQLAYSNAQSLVQNRGDRDIIIDSSVLGMGRGAGNLNTELFAEYLNENIVRKYNIRPILKLIDEVITKIQIEYTWGYSIPFYLTAIYNCHPNYGSFLAEKNTLKIEAINEIIGSISTEEKNYYNEQYIQGLYELYQNHYINDTNTRTELTHILKDKSVLLVAPGRSLEEEQEVFSKALKTYNIVIAVNFIPKQVLCNFIFISNLKRYDACKKYQGSRKILTSNISRKQEEGFIVNYGSLVNSKTNTFDNSGIMLLNLLKHLGVNKVGLVGFDGYSQDIEANYISSELMLANKKETLEILNKEMKEALKEISEVMDVNLLTSSKYQ